jgi:transposase-like protein
VKINGKQHYLWRAVGQDGEVVDVFLQARREGPAAKRFFKRLLRSHGGEPRKIVTDKLRSYDVAHRELIPDVIYDSTDNTAARYKIDLFRKCTQYRRCYALAFGCQGVIDQ